MKHLKKLIALAMVAATVLAVAVPAMAAYSTMYVNVGAGQTVRLRNAPNTNGTVLINIPHGTAVQAEYYNSTWHKVKYSSYTGYMMSTFLSTSNPGGGTGGSGGTPTAGKIQVSSGPVNVRAGAGTNYASIAQLNNGAKITYYAGVTYSGSGYTWYRCTGSQWSGDGYIATNYVVPDTGSGGGNNTWQSRYGTENFVKRQAPYGSFFINVQKDLNTYYERNGLTNYAVYPLDEDGIFWDATNVAVITFQQREFGEYDSIVGPETKARLYEKTR